MKKMFSILDVKCSTYMPPFYESHSEIAKRNLVEASKNPESLLGKYPDDFVLFEVGMFDETTCMVEQASAKISLGTVRELQGLFQG